jgi:hypothetical protein
MARFRVQVWLILCFVAEIEDVEVMLILAMSFLTWRGRLNLRTDAVWFR